MIRGIATLLTDPDTAHQCIVVAPSAHALWDILATRYANPNKLDEGKFLPVDIRTRGK